MTLTEIECALRPQFIWEPGDNWKTSKEFEGGRHIGITVFVGIATMHKFTPADISKMLNISIDRYEELWFDFKNYIWFALTHQDDKGKKPFRGASLWTKDNKPRSLLIEHTKKKNKAEWQTILNMRKKKVYIKSTLVQSYLAHKYSAPKISFADLLTPGN